MKKLPKTHRFSFEKATLGLAKEGFSVACVYKTIWQKYKDSILQKSIPDVGIFIRGGCALLPRSQFGSENFHCPLHFKSAFVASLSPTCKAIRLKTFRQWLQETLSRCTVLRLMRNMDKFLSQITRIQYVLSLRRLCWLWQSDKSRMPALLI